MNIASLTIQMAADVAKLRGDMDAAKGVVGDAMQQIERAAGMAGKALAALGVAGSVVGLADFVKTTIDATANLYRMSQQAGVAVESLSAMRGVAKLSGTDMGDVVTSLQKLSRSMVDAQSGSGKAADAFKALGVNIYNASGQLKSADQVQLEVAQSLQNFQAGAATTAVTIDLMGKSAANLAPYLADLAEKGDLNGKITAEQARQAQEFERQTIRAQAAVRGWFTGMALELLPVLMSVREITQLLGQAIGEYLSGSATSASNKFDLMRLSLAGVGTVLEALIVFSSDVAFVFKSMGNEIGGIIAQFNALGEGGGIFTAEGRAAWTRVGEMMRTDAKQSREELDRFQAAVLGSTDRVLQARDALQNHGLSAAENRAEMDRLAAQHGVTAKATLNYKAAVDDAKVAQDRAAAAGADLLLQSTFKLQSMQQEVELQRPLTEGEKLLAKVAEELAAKKIVLTATQYEGIKAIAAGMDAAKAEADQLKAVAKANEEAAKAYEKTYDATAKQTAKLIEENQAMAAANATLLTGVDVTKQLEAAKLRDEAVTLERMAIVAADKNLQYDLAEAYRAQAQALRDRAGLIEQGVAIKEAKAAQAEWQKTIDSINDGLTGALMRAFESGKGFFQAFRDTLVNAFKSLVLQPTIKAILAPVSGAIGSLFGVPNAMAGTGADAGGSLMGSLSSLMSGGMNLLSGATGSMLGLNIVNSSIGQALGLSSVQNIGGNMIAGPTAMGSLVGSGLGMLGNGFMGYGISKALSGGYSAGNGINVLAGIASAIPGVGPIAGVVGALVNRAFGLKAKEMKDYGIEGSLSGGAATGQTYQDWMQKGGWFRSDRRGTDYSAMSDDIKAALDAGAKGILDQTRAYAQALKLPADALSSVTANFKTKLTDDQKANQAAIELIFQGYSDALTSQFEATLQPFRKAGETLADTMSRLAAVAGFSDSINQLGGIFARLANSSLDARENVIALAGGIDKLMAKAGAFVKDYYTEAEQAGLQSVSVQKTLAAVGLSGATLGSRDDFRRLVESVDLSTEQGQRQLVTLLDLAPQFAQLADYLQKQGLTLQDAAKAAPQVAALKDLLDPAISTAQAVDNLGTITRQGNDLLQRIVDSINSGNESIANGLSILATLNQRIADAQARANAIADQTAKSINTLAGNASLSSSAPTYTYDIGARDVP